MKAVTQLIARLTILCYFLVASMAAAHAFGAEAIGVLGGQVLTAPEASEVSGTRPDVVVEDLAVVDLVVVEARVAPHAQ